jgi:hypothetical protein
MAHYAILDSDNIVTQVIVADDDNLESDLSTQYNATVKRTSYNTSKGVHLNGGTAFRKNYAGLGYKYDSTKDAFIPPKPFDSWILNTTTCIWQAPTDPPNDNNTYLWDEDSVSWVLEI